MDKFIWMILGLILLMVGGVVFGFLKSLKDEKKERDIIARFFGTDGIWLNREVDGKFITFVYEKAKFDETISLYKTEEEKA